MTIPTILNTQNTAPQTQSSEVNSAALEDSYNRTLQQSNQLLNLQASNLDKAKLQADRAEAIAQETVTHAALNLPETNLKLQQSSVNLIGVLASINEEQKKKQEKSINESWLASQKFNIESGYTADTQQALTNIAPDGSGYANGRIAYYDKALISAKEHAPSMDAFLDLYKEVQVRKVDTYKKAAEIEQNQRVSFNQNMIDSGVNSMVNTVRTNPTLVSNAITNLSTLDKALKANGKSDTEIKDYKLRSEQTLVSEAINGFIDSKNMDGAKNLLLNNKALNQLEPKSYNKIVDDIHTANERLIKDQEQNAEKAKIQSLIINKAVDRTYPGVTEEGDKMFSTFANSSLSNIDSKGIDGVVNDLYGFLNEYGFAMGNKTSGRLAGIISNSQDPVQVAAYSLLINKLSKNPQTAGANVYKELGDKDSIAEATLIGNYVENGVEPAEAMRLARDDVRLKYNPAKEAQIKKYLDTLDTTKGSNMVGNANNFWDQLAFSLYDGIGPDSEVSSDNAMYDMKQAYKAFYIETQNQDVALARTRQYLQHAGYGITYANGEKELNKAVPEVFYKDKNLLQEFYFNAFKAINNEGYSFVSNPLIGSATEKGSKLGYVDFSSVKDNPNRYMDISKAIVNGITGSQWNPTDQVSILAKNLVNLPQTALEGGRFEYHSGFWVKNDKTGEVSKLILKPIEGQTQNEPLSRKTYNLVDSTTNIPVFQYVFDTSKSGIKKDQDKRRQYLSEQRNKENSNTLNALNQNDMILKAKK